MQLKKKEEEVLRWYAAGHSLQMIEQYVDLERREINIILKNLGITNTAEAFDILHGSKDIDQLERSDDNLPNAGEEVPEFKPTPNANKLKDYDKRKIAARGGNEIDIIPMSLEQAFRLDIRWRPLAEIEAKWLSYANTPEILKEVILQFSPASFKRLYGAE